ncbi:MAG: hypothetical protein KDA96_16225 [Planctomycetaceae bacterium]|nr:hypothetical protein [Planctomycetaceae bacterium]
MIPGNQENASRSAFANQSSLDKRSDRSREETAGHEYLFTRCSLYMNN